MRGINFLPTHRKSQCCDTIGIASYRIIYLFRNKARHVNWKAANPGFCEQMEVTYRLEDLGVPQVGNPCLRSLQLVANTKKM